VVLGCDAQHRFSLFDDPRIVTLPKRKGSRLYRFVRARCRACRTTGDVNLRTPDWPRSAAVTAFTPVLLCRSCRPNAPFAELVCLSKWSVAEEHYAERSGIRWGDG
jgi:hypothetical protein